VRTATPPRATSRRPLIAVDSPYRRWFKWLLLLPLGLLVWWIGRAVGLGGTQQAIALVVAGVVLVIVVGGVLIARRVGHGALALELPVVLLLLSTLVFRQRSAVDLAGDPLDAAAQFRVAAVGLAALLGIFALVWGQGAGLKRVTTLPFRLYALYVLVVFAGAPGSVDPPLTAYRGAELVAGLIVLAGARRKLGEQAVPRIEATLYWFCVVMLVAAWANVVLYPDDAIIRLANPAIPIEWQIQSVYPSIAPNGVGLLGVIVAAWSPARIRQGVGQAGLRWPVAYLLAGVGTFTLIAAQYRTGYVALPAALAIYVLVRGKKVLATILVGTAVSVAIWAPTATKEAQPYLLRGQDVEQIGDLSRRTEYWRHALPIWEQSPLIGRGLLTASRFEVLAPLGLQYTAGIHGTWPEALVGTGVIGTALLALVFLITVGRAIREARGAGRVAPLLLLTVLAVRSVTGPTFESFHYTALIFLWLTLSMEDIRGRRPADEEPAPTPSPGAQRRPAPAPALPSR
jgi:O-antigen ligase